MSESTNGRRVVVITGAGSGMGREAVLKFAADGDHVVVADIDEAAASQAAADAPGSAEAYKIDMTDLGALEGLVKHVESTHGRLDVLWNHAGSEGPRGWDFDVAKWDRMVTLNLTAPVFLTKAAWPLLQSAPNGASVLFTASVSALIASRNSPVYSAVKTGLVGFMRAMAAVGGPDGIRSNAICPGATETPMLRKFFGEEHESDDVINERLLSFQESVPLRRYGRPEEVADLGVFLASDRGAFITGVAIPIDGGYVAL